MGRGVTIHRVDCPNLKDLEKNKERFIEVSWDQKDKSTSYETQIQITANDRKGLLSEITILINDENFTVNGLNAKKENDNIATINIRVEIVNKKHLTKLVNRLKGLEDVIEVKRITS
jgi:GTP pyrophosphokinase